MPKKITIEPIKPLTLNQKKAFEAYAEGKNLFLHGLAGTGKTFIALYMALAETHAPEKGPYEKVLMVRSAKSVRDQGFLPGDLKEKEEPYFAVYKDIINKLANDKTAAKKLETNGKVSFCTTSFMRGLTIDNTIIILDECQNLTFDEISTVVTRMGKNCKIIICGDINQTDLDNRERKDIHKTFTIFDKMKEFESIEFQIADIVRSGIVKSFLIQKYKLGY